MPTCRRWHAGEGVGLAHANACVGHIRGGLAFAAVLACMLFAALSGSSPATVVTVGSIAVAGMVRSGYPKEFGAGINCNAGTLGILIPPSIVMVVYSAFVALLVYRGMTLRDCAKALLESGRLSILLLFLILVT